MLGSLIKRRLTENQVANIFINTLFESISQGFKEVALLINEDPVFITSPQIDETNDTEFSLIVFVGNINFLENTFDPPVASNIKALIVEKLAKVYGLNTDKMGELLKEYKSFISRVNHPSKNMVYGMSKTIFYKYELNNFQEDYFRKMQVPNPLFLKRLDDVVSSFLWDWDSFFKKYKI